MFFKVNKTKFYFILHYDVFSRTNQKKRKTEECYLFFILLHLATFCAKLNTKIWNNFKIKQMLVYQYPVDAFLTKYKQYEQKETISVQVNKIFFIYLN